MQHLFSGADLHGEESKNQLFVFDLKSEVCGCGKWKGLQYHVWAKDRAGRFGVNCCIAQGISLCRQLGPVAPGHVPLVPPDADCRRTLLSQTFILLISVHLCFYMICNMLWRVHWLCQMAFSLFPRWGCQFSMLHKCWFVLGPHFGAKQLIHLLRNPGVKPESRACTCQYPAACMDANQCMLLGLGKKSNRNESLCSGLD